MIRLFAPAPPGPGPSRTAITVGNLVLHVALVAALLAPLAPEVRQALLDREVLYLIPPTQSGGPEREADAPTFRSAATPAGPMPAQSAEPREGPAAEQEGNPSLELSVSGLRPAQASRVMRETALTELEVDSTVVRDPSSAAPVYPPLLLARAMAGSVTVRYVVDTLGAIDPVTYRVLSMSHEGFAQAVRDALPGMRFRPAFQRGRRVRQWVEQTFQFRITRRDTTGTPA